MRIKEANDVATRSAGAQIRDDRFGQFVMAQLSSATSEEAFAGQIGCRSSQSLRGFRD